jgi:hypothetical protein
MLGFGQQIDNRLTTDRIGSMWVDFVSDDRAIRNILTGYKQLAAERVADGWHPSIVSMMFRRLSPMHGPVLAQMFREAELVYGTFVTRVVRRPLSRRSVSELPVMIVAPDASVGKRDKPLARIELNGGGLHLRHSAGAAALPAPGVGRGALSAAPGALRA